VDRRLPERFTQITLGHCATRARVRIAVRFIIISPSLDIYRRLLVSLLAPVLRSLSLFFSIALAIYSYRRLPVSLLAPARITILLCGCEMWFLREDLFAKLRTFHNRCCRAMCRITMAHAIRHHIKSKQLHKRLGIAAVDQAQEGCGLMDIGVVGRVGGVPAALGSSWRRVYRGGGSTGGSP
jgi:hypothetical protein